MAIRNRNITLHRIVRLAVLILALMCVSGWTFFLKSDALPEFRLTLLASDPAGGGDAAISPDGSRLVTSSHRAGAWDLWMYEIASRRWSQLTYNQGDNLEGQWSPDGRKIVFTSTRAGNKDIFTLDLETGDQTQLTNDPDDDEYPAWSPSGKTIVYTGGPWGKRDFFLVPASGGAARKLTRQPGMAGACSFMPSGDSVICHSYDLGSGNISILPMDGEDPVAVTRGAAWDYKPTVCPRGGWVAFSRTHEGPTNIWLKELNGERLVSLTISRYEDRWPTWNAAGDKLLFHRLVDFGTAIKVLNRRSGRLITVAGAEEKPEQASFDPAAKRVVYTTEMDGRRELRIRSIYSGETHTLRIDGTTDVAFPRWSPDNKRIAFLAKVGDRWEVATINVDGTDLHAWTQRYPELHGMYGVLDWSPDSAKLVFHADTRPFEANLYTLDLRTNKLENITNDRWFDEAASWTTDGRSVLYMSTRGGNWTWGLFHLSLADHKIVPFVTPDYTEKDFPRMGKGGWITWSEFDDKGFEHVVERAPDGHVHTVDEFGPGARWPSFSHDGKLMLATTTVRKVEYWLAENLFSAGSPLLDETHARAQSDLQPGPTFSQLKLPPATGTLERSPVHPYHR